MSDLFSIAFGFGLVRFSHLLTLVLLFWCDVVWCKSYFKNFRSCLPIIKKLFPITESIEILWLIGGTSTTDRTYEILWLIG